jgi:hypothetical protein
VFRALSLWTAICTIFQESWPKPEVCVLGYAEEASGNLVGGRDRFPELPGQRRPALPRNRSERLGRRYPHPKEQAMQNDLDRKACESAFQASISEIWQVLEAAVIGAADKKEINAACERARLGMQKARHTLEISLKLCRELG